MHRKRLRLAVTVGSVVAVTASLAATTQAASGAPKAKHPLARFDRVAKQTVGSKYIHGLGNRQTTVMVQAAGRPITVVQADAGHALTHGRQQEVRSNLESTQSSIASAVRALGGRVGPTYQAAYNGMKVTIAANKVNALRKIPNVVGVHPLTPKSLDNIHGVPLIGAPQVWGGVAGANGFAGKGIKVAVIDTGIDYTHADFGGPGTPGAYQAALATDTQPADPSMFGPNAPRVKGGYDFVGDDYDATPSDPNYQPVPHPDPNPLDCYGHGTHTAGTAAGSGVLANGNTYTGPYKANTVSSHNWNVGPGVAPKADIYSLRIFGCAGSTNVTIDAIEWAVDHHMDVINMSLGSPFGGRDDPDAVASDNAAKAGTIVVTSAGNEGPNPYMVGTPGTANGAISTAAIDPTKTFPAANIALSTGTTVQAIDANGIPVNGLSAPIKVLYSGTPHDAAHISLGCDPAEYTAANVAGDIVVVKRGTCARVARAIFGEQAGAAAVIMVNTEDTFPPFEGPITSNPDTGAPFNVTIPFLGVKSSSADALVAADGTNATLTDTTLANPAYLATAGFSSGGPRSGDSALKPDLSGPGVSIASAGMGTGNAAAVMSGTSMASPHVAGSAALVREAHPSWKQVRYWKAALVNTADSSMVADYSTRLNGTGLAQVQHAVATNAVALGTRNTATLSYGYAELRHNYTKSRDIDVYNLGNRPITFTIGHRLDTGSPHSVSLSRHSVTLPAHSKREVWVTLRVPAATAGDSSDFHDVSGLVTLTPQHGGNHGVSLSMAYYLVPHAVSKVRTSLNTKQLQKKGAATAFLRNEGVVTGNADWYAWGTLDPKEPALGSNDIQAVGVQSFPSDKMLAFGLSTYKRWSNAASDEFDIDVDVNRDGKPDYVVVEADLGLVTAGENDGTPAVFVFDLRTGDGTLEFLADAPTDSSTMALPVAFDQLCASGSPCLSQSHPRITYSATGFDATTGSEDDPASDASFNVFNPSVSTGMFDTVAPHHKVRQQVTYNRTEFARTPARGFMVITHDNPTGSEARLIRIR